MIRALGAATVILGLVCLVSGCHEEPTIVIKFEPNDAATKPVDMTRAADLVSAPDLAPVKTAAKGAKPECKRASDCVIDRVDCCDCANGGKQHAVPKKELAKLKAAREARCKQAMCTMMLSTDPTCGQEADCVAGACVMAPRKKK